VKNLEQSISIRPKIIQLWGCETCRSMRSMSS